MCCPWTHRCVKLKIDCVVFKVCMQIKNYHSNCFHTVVKYLLIIIYLCTSLLNSSALVIFHQKRKLPLDITSLLVKRYGARAGLQWQTDCKLVFKSFPFKRSNQLSVEEIKSRLTFFFIAEVVSLGYTSRYEKKTIATSVLCKHNSF